jgi:hypothetical protein
MGASSKTLVDSSHGDSTGGKAKSKVLHDGLTKF